MLSPRFKQQQSLRDPADPKHFQGFLKFAVPVISEIWAPGQILQLLWANARHVVTQHLYIP